MQRTAAHLPVSRTLMYCVHPSRGEKQVVVVVNNRRSNSSKTYSLGHKGDKAGQYKPYLNKSTSSETEYPHHLYHYHHHHHTTYITFQAPGYEAWYIHTEYSSIYHYIRSSTAVNKNAKTGVRISGLTVPFQDWGGVQGTTLTETPTSDLLHPSSCIPRCRGGSCFHSTHHSDSPQPVHSFLSTLTGDTRLQYRCVCVCVVVVVKCRYGM